MSITLKNDQLILAENQYYSLDCYETQLNNNVLVVGTSGSGKTRSIVTPNLLQAVGSYVVSDPKGSLYDKYGDYLRKQGYKVRKLDFTNPSESCGWNFFNYIHTPLDIVKISHMFIDANHHGQRGVDPFWDEAAQLLLQAIIGYLYEFPHVSDRKLSSILKLMDQMNCSGDMENEHTILDTIFDEVKRKNPNSFALSCYQKFRVAANRTLRSIMITLNACMTAYTTPEICSMTSMDEVDLLGIGTEKTALFVVVSDTDRSLDGLVNLFFTQAMNELVTFADRSCEENRLPIPVRFILDDFATNCKIADFPRMIASIRSRGISTMLMIQAESQLTACYGEDGRTIIGNCDTYIYLGGNDYETADSVAKRSDLPIRKVLNMPVGTNWIFRRGDEPVNSKNFDLNAYLKEKGLDR